MDVLRSALLGLVFLFSNSVKAEEIRLEARAGVDPSCLFTDSGLGKRSGFGFRRVCDATFGVGFGCSDFPILLDVDRHLLYASPNIKTTEGYLLNMTSLITTVLASSSMKIGAQNNFGLLYGMGLFFGEHSFNLELPDPGTMGNSRRVISQDRGIAAKAGVGVSISSRMDLQITWVIVSSSKKVFPGQEKFQILTVGTPVIASNWSF